VPKVIVEAREALEDIRNGMNDSDLAEKYGLSAIGLQSLFNKLVAAGLVTCAELNSRTHWSQKKVKLDIGAENEPAAKQVSEPRNAKIKIDPRRVVSDIRYGLGDSELMEKYGLSLGSFQRLVKRLLDEGMLTQAELDHRRHWTDKSVKLERFVCPACNMPQFHEFEICPQCGVIVAKYPKALAEGRARKDFWTIRTGRYTFKLKRSGDALTLAGLEKPLQQEIVEKVKNLMTMKLQEGGKDGKAVGSHFWATLAGGVSERKKTTYGKDKKFYLIEMGPYLIMPSVDGTSLTIERLREGLQREILAMIQGHLETREMEEDQKGRAGGIKDQGLRLKGMK